MYFSSIKNLVEGGGKVVHIRKGNRSITIVYYPDRERGTLQYGAVIHKKESPSDKWCRKESSKHALQRFNEGPIVLADPMRNALPRTRGVAITRLNVIREQMFNKRLGISTYDVGNK